MIRPLLNGRYLPKPLRQALLLLAMLILPSAAWGQDYSLSVAGVQVTNANKDNVLNDGGKVKFTPDNGTDGNILTLDGASITGSIESGLDNLTILIKGNNYITNTDDQVSSSVLISTNAAAPLTFTNEGNAELKISNTYINGRKPLIWNFGSIDYETAGLSTISPMPVKYVETTIGTNTAKGLIPAYNETEIYDLSDVTFTTATVYPLWVAGNQPTEANKSNFAANTSFTPASGSNRAKLSFTGATLNFNGKIISGVGDLEVYFSGENTISITTPGDTTAVIRSMDSDAKLYFTSASNSSLVLQQYSAANEYSVIHSFNSIELGDGIYQETKAPSTYDNTSYNGLSSAIDNSPLHYVKLSTSPAYPIWVSNGDAYFQATESNKDNVLASQISTPPVTFTPATGSTPGTLTLNDADVSAIYSGLGDLTIYLKWVNKITGSGSSLITSLNGGTLTFDSEGKEVSTLTFTNSSGTGIPISGFSKVEYGTWLEYDESSSTKKIKSWEINIAKGDNNAQRINADNKDDILEDGGSVRYSYDATNGHVITLNKAEITYIWTDIHADITIALNGTNKAINTVGTYAIYSNNGDINIVKAEGAESAELEAQAGSNLAISSYTVGSGLYEKPISTIHTIITDDPEFVIVGDRVITNGQTISGIQGSISYSESEGEKVLTLTGFLETFGSGHGNMNAIETGVIGLKVKLVGDNYITCSDNNTYAFKGTHDNASIQFIKEGSGSKLTMTTLSNPLSFGSGKVTYDGLIYLSEANEKYICEPTAPAMSLDNEKVKLTKDYDDGTIYYSIDYADDTEDETEVTYSAPFALAAPATVTAWVEANNATTSTIKGKHFGYEDAPFTMKVGDTKALPKMIPAIEDGDGIAIMEDPSILDPTIATLSEGIINAEGVGNTILTAIVGNTNGTIVVLGENVTAEIYVGENLSNYFEGSNEFCTFYNEDNEIYAVPQGMKAYVVTGVNGNKLVTEETTVLPPNTVVLLDKAEGIAFTKVPSEGAAPGGNLLKRATSEVAVTSTSLFYVLYNDMYVKASPGSPIPSGKNYLDLGSDQVAVNGVNARGFYYIGDGDDDGSTGMGATLMDNGLIMDNYYDLQGRKIQKPTKPGLYIRNGKKEIFK